MAKVEIYTTMLCPYCHRAKRLLRRKGIPFREIGVTFHPDRRREMARRANGRNTVPQVFIDGEHIGGCDELVALERAGGLDVKLRTAS
jgi:glutaredoxin 3